MLYLYNDLFQDYHVCLGKEAFHLQMESPKLQIFFSFSMAIFHLLLLRRICLHHPGSSLSVSCGLLLDHP